MANNNHVTLSGNLTAEPTLHTAETGTARCSLRLAVSGREKTANGWQNRPSYFDITAFGELAEQVSDQLTKGAKIAVEGRLRWRQWTASDGSKRQNVEIVASTITALTKPAEEAAEPVAVA
ncbi:MAG TPA: single-stranded DNA-binding protein [Baekduia sp.]|nr:single-stranded DNA-binding protein [Baekduia sp.]